MGRHDLHYYLIRRPREWLLYRALPSSITVALLRAWCLLHGGHRFETLPWSGPDLCRYCAAENDKREE